ncbi:hypothetical protein C8Q80DRAFT_1267424 [Daedaleopsis nitida]|nr:hypothetical protein C8Q80DRAFT_1267424 [Daedaleopsis nitida]
MDTRHGSLFVRPLPAFIPLTTLSASLVLLAMSSLQPTIDTGGAVFAASNAADPSSASIDHAPRPVDPSAGPVQLSPKHPNLVNYAISAGGVLIGVAFITTFALICRWRKRRRQRALDDEIDGRIRDKSLSRLEANRTHSVAKLPAAALSNDQLVIHPLPNLTSTAISPRAAGDRTVPRARQACIRSTDQRLPCGCPDCLVLAGSSSLATSTSTSAHAHRTVRYTSSFSSTRFPRIAAAISPRSTPRSTATRARGNYTSNPRAHRRTDENTHRVASTRTSSPRFVPPDATWAGDMRASTVAQAPAHMTGVGMGLVVAASAGSLGCSPIPATPPLVFATPWMAGSPAFSLSDDAGATTLTPTASRTSCAGQRQSFADPNSSVELAASLGRLGYPLAHMTVASPTRKDEIVGTSSGSSCPSPSSPATPPASIHHWHKPSLTVADDHNLFKTPDPSRTPIGSSVPLLPLPVHEEEHGQKWFTDVDWDGADSPLACFD